MTFWQHRGGTPFRAQKTVDLQAPSSLRARKGQKLAPSKRDPTSTGPETLKRLKTNGKSGEMGKNDICVEQCRKIRKMGNTYSGFAPPTVLKAFPGPRGRPDPQIDRFPTPNKIRPDCLQVPSLNCSVQRGSSIGRL